MRYGLGGALRLLVIGLLVAVAFPATAAALSTGSGIWHWQAPLPQGDKLLAVDFVDSATGWAIGQSGTILHTTDGGATWHGQLSGTGGNLTGLSFVDAEHGWVIGDAVLTPGGSDGQTSRALLHTTDGGATWRRVPLPGSQWLYVPKQVCFVDDQNGWIVGNTDGYRNVLIHTTDGGHTWSYEDVQSWLGVEGIDFTSPTRGWAVTPTSVCRTDDGGMTWTEVRDDMTFPHWTYVRAIGDTVWIGNAEGVYYYSPLMMKSTDAGATWTTVTSPPELLCAPVFLDADHGYGLTRNMGQGIVATSDGGATWTSQYKDLWVSDSSNVDPLGIAIAAGDELHAFVVGTFGAITATSDGSTWGRVSTSLTREAFTQVAFPDASDGWVLTHTGKMFHTTDGGVTWAPAGPAGLNNAGCMTFADADHGWIGISTDYDRGSALLRTTDGGKTWEYLPTTGTDMSWMAPTKMQFLDDLHGWALLSYAGTLAHTDDGGVTWQVMDMETTGAGMRDTIDFAFTDPDHGVIVGWPSQTIDGKLIGRTAYTDDGGKTWHPDGVAQDPNGSVMQRVVFGDALHGYVISSNPSAIWTSADGGKSWQKVDLAGQEPSLPQAVLDSTFRDIAAIDADSAIVVTRQGRVLRTDDAGAVWYEQDAGPQRPDLGYYDPGLLEAVCALDPAHIWAVGNNGTIISTYAGYSGADATAPVTHVPEADGAWHSDARVALAPADAQSGVVATRARVDGGAWWHGDRVPMSAGVHDLTVSSTDAAGNTETPATVQVKVDLQPPETRITARDTWTDQDVSVKLEATDDRSGVAVTRHSEFGYLPTTGTSFTVPALPDGRNDGQHMVLYWSEDAAGNIEAVHQTTVQIDTWSPETTSDDDGALVVGRTAIDLTATDPQPAANVVVSGVAGTYYAIDGGAYKEAVDAPPVATAPSAGLLRALGAGSSALTSIAYIDPAADGLADGAHTVSFYSVDEAGNAEKPSSISVVVDNVLTTALTTVGKTATNQPTATWSVPTGWQAVRVEVSAADAVDAAGAFSTTLAAADLTPADTSWTFSALSPLHPGTYYVHVRFSRSAPALSGWTPVKELTVAATAAPALVSPASLKLTSARRSGRKVLKVAYRVTVRDDSLGSTQLKLTQERVVHGRVVARRSATFTVDAPLTLGSGTHTYPFTWVRPRALAGSGTYRVIAQAEDQEYNWSRKLTAGRTTTF